MRFRLRGLVGIGALALGLWLASLEGLQAPLTSIDQPQATAIVKLEFGLAHSEPREWEGRVEVSAGEALSTWGWHFIKPDRVIGASGWAFSTRDFMPADAAYRSAESLPNGVKVMPNGVYVALKAPPSTQITVNTNHGNFAFRLSDLKSTGRAAFLDGDVHAVYTPPTRFLTRGEASQHDFPSVASNGSELYVSWTTFHNESNLVYLARRAGDGWETHRVSPEWGDYSGNAVAVDRKGRAVVVWSSFDGRRWRLLSRRFDPSAARWEEPRYVAPAGTRQLFPKMTTDVAGAPWVAWQGDNGGNFDIFAARLDDAWSPPLRLSESEANDWVPAIAAAPDGSLRVAWDSYAEGNYDIHLREIRDGKPGSLRRITRAPTWDAYPSIAVDSKNYTWLAWTESGPNWGKDWGVIAQPGTQMRASRRIRLARIDGDRIEEPAQALEKAVPAWLGSMHEYPQVAIGPNDQPWLFFRRNLHRLPMPEDELLLGFGSERSKINPWHDSVRMMSDIHVTGFDGEKWLPVRQLPESYGRAAMQTGAAIHDGKLIYVWPVDGRTYMDPQCRAAQIHYAEFEPSTAAPAGASMRAFVSEPGGAPDAAPTEAADLARVRAARWADREPLRLYRGDLHRHTDISADSMLDGDILDAYRYALDVSSLDFLAVTDHSGEERLNYYHYQWWRNRQVATMFNRPGIFATFFAYERTVQFPGGHRNVISTRRDAQPVPISDEESSGVQGYGERLFPELRRNGDIAIPHTTAGGGGTDWRDGDPLAQPLVEIFQGLRGSYEAEDTPAAARGRNRPVGFVWNAWAMGRRVGVITSSDHHSTHQSYACVWAPELSAEAILTAMKQRRTYGATDNIVLKFEAEGSEGRIHKLGREFSTARPPRLRFQVEGTTAIANIELIRNGSILLAAEPGRRQASFDFKDEDRPEGTSFYHVRLVQENDQVAWSSPIWVD